MSDHYEVSSFISALRERTPGEGEFHQSVEEFLCDVVPVVNETPHYQGHALLERLTEPDRVISFRVSWQRDDGVIQVNRGYRVQFNGAIGPYKGGLRFHPSVNQSILKFLGFEQTFKNALTGLPMGGGKGGSDFDPKGCSESEIARFCQAFMLELHRYIGQDRDIPAGDINVGMREIGYLFGAYRRITGNHTGVLTGKGLTYGGSEMRMEATGHGLIHFLCCMLEAHDMALEGQSVVISGAGNVATHAAEKAIEAGARVLTLSDSGGFIHDREGLDNEKIDWVRRHKSKPDASLKDYSEAFDADWHEGKKPWAVEATIALPCATQNEITENDAKALVEAGYKAVAEGANMPLTKGARKVVSDAGVLFGPAKAANAGGVTLSGLEISQNRIRRSTSRGELADELKSLMQEIHDACASEGKGTEGRINYARGANIAGFRKVADAMVAQQVS